MDELKFLASYYVSVLLIIAVGDRARRSPRKLPTSMKEERKKWVMPKFLPHKYDVKLVNEDKVRHWFSCCERLKHQRKCIFHHYYLVLITYLLHSKFNIAFILSY